MFTGGNEFLIKTLHNGIMLDGAQHRHIEHGSDGCSTASYWAEKQARINSISPGIIDTPMGNLELQQQTEILRSLIDATPLQRMGSPDETADCIDFLLSEKSSFITNTDILVDGGISSLA